MVAIMINPSLYRRYKWFHKHMGGIVGKRAMGALELARVDMIRDKAPEGAIKFLWEWDEDHDRGPIDWGWSDSAIKRWNLSTHSVEVLTLVIHGEPVDSLCGIWDADEAYRTLLETEMLSEYLSSSDSLGLGLN